MKKYRIESDRDHYITLWDGTEVSTRSRFVFNIVAANDEEADQIYEQMLFEHDQRVLHNEALKHSQDLYDKETREYWENFYGRKFD